MALNRAVLERQLERADARLAAREKSLAAAGVSNDDLKSTPAWRRSEALRRQIRRRLRSAEGVQSRGAASTDESDE